MQMSFEDSEHILFTRVALFTRLGPEIVGNLDDHVTSL